MIHRILWLLAILLALPTPPIQGATGAPGADLPWTVPDAPYRAVVTLRESPVNPEGGILINLRDFGQIRADMADVLLTDAQGLPLPIAKISSVAGSRTLLLAQNLNPKQDYLVYFGGDKKRNAPEWTPKTSLFMETRRAPADLKMETWQDLKTAWNQGTEVDGAGFVSSIYHGANPFGSSYDFITHYTGYLFMPEEKPITFYTLSSDASFVFVNDRFEFGWPGQHTPDASPKKVSSKSVQCPAGLVKIDYYAAKGGRLQKGRRSGPAMVLGWKGGEQFEAIPAQCWLHPGKTAVHRIEESHGFPIPLPKIELRSLMGYGGEWLYETSFSLDLKPQELEGWTVSWTFADGATFSGTAGTRVLAGPGPDADADPTSGEKPQTVTVTLNRVAAPDATTSSPASATLSTVSKIDFAGQLQRHPHHQQTQGPPRASIRNPADVRRYIGLLESDDFSKLSTESLAARLKFLIDWGTDSEIAKPAMAWLARNPAPGDLLWMPCQAVAIRTRAETDPARALTDLRNLDLNSDPRTRKRHAESFALLEMDLLVFKMRNPEAATRLTQIAFQNPVSDLAQTAKVRLGDLYRLLGHYKEAIAQYQSIGIKADDKSLPAQDRAYSITVRNLLQSETRDAAQSQLSQWEMKHPMAKFDSDFLLLRARALMLFGRWSEALAEIESYEKVQPEGPYQIDAEFFRGRLLYEQDHKEEARKIWSSLAKSYPKHPLAPQAVEWAKKP